ncbi:MAG TPA: serine/threonine-protein kinase [Polyangia bacterium]|jgi:serine/threonine-protein kinase
MIGRTIGNYVVRDKIGEGGMGVVFRAEHPHINRSVAIKVLHPGADRNPEVVHRFFNEARAATEIRNEHIVEVLDFGELPEGTPYLVMEWLEGESLGNLLRSVKKVPLGRAAHIMSGIARALRAAHGKGVVHRDLKPDNVFLVRRDGESDLVKVLDFGIAKLLATGMPVRYQTQTGAIIGTPAYMSPEQCRGAKEIDHRTDVYALGVIGYQMLTGRLPFEAEALGELLLKHMTETPVPPDAVEPLVPPALSLVIARALEKEPEKRPSLDEITFIMDSVVAADAAPHSGAVLTSAALSASFASMSHAMGAHTTLGASASQVGLERRLPAPRRTGLIIGAVVVAAGAAVTAFVLRGGHHVPPPPAVAAVPAPVVSPPVAPPVAQVGIAIRTDPDSARLELDGELVGNPFARTLPKDGRPHRITATLTGFGPVAQTISFDRDRELILKLVPEAGAAPASEPRSARAANTRAKSSGQSSGQSSGRTRTGEAEAPAAEPRHSKSAGYRGSNLNIETEFPGPR